MNRLSQAFRTFIRILRDEEFASRAQAVEEAPALPPVRRNEALTLLAVLQREGRLVDFMQESIDEYSDAQVGAAVRDMHRSCRKALDRMFELKPVMAQEEGTPVTVEKGYDPGKISLAGNVTGEPPFTGTLCHAGWEAARTDLPVWDGSDEAARVVAPAEIELK